MDRAEKTARARHYTPAESAQALERAKEIGAAAAGRELGIHDGTIRNWRCTERRAAEVASKSPEPESQAATEPQAAKAKAVAKSYTPSLRARALEYVAQHGVTAAAKKFGVTRFSIYNWQRKVELHAQGKAVDSPVTGSDEDQTALRDDNLLFEPSNTDKAKKWPLEGAFRPDQTKPGHASSHARTAGPPGPAEHRPLHPPSAAPNYTHLTPYDLKEMHERFHPRNQAIGAGFFQDLPES